jgi:tetratricopeptide (TPR) repeat protein
MTSSSKHDGKGAPGSFVGRGQELAELRSALDEISARGRVFLISGEPGIGKTRLVDELAAEARGRSVRVVWGRCWEGGGTPAYWPFIQIVRGCLESIGPDSRDSILDYKIDSHVVEEISKIVPELRPADGDKSPRRQSVDPETARFRLFDAVANFLKTLAHLSPILIVIDDLHVADLAALSMLGFVAHEVHDAKILIISTYRDAELRHSPERLKLVEQILHEGHQLPLAGLGESEVGQMVESRAGRQASEALVAKIHWLTGGNPLFIDGVVRVLAAEGKLTQVAHSDPGELKLPDNVRAAIACRLGMLSEEVRDVLAKAAVIGQEFELALLARINELSDDAFADSVRQASELGIISRTTPNVCRFAHPLIREALYEDLKNAAQIATHRAIGEALERLYAPIVSTDLANKAYDPSLNSRPEDSAYRWVTPHLSALAHHFRKACAVEKALDYSIRAGYACSTVFAHEEALSHWLAALELTAEGDSDLRMRATLHENLGDLFLNERAEMTKHYESALRCYERLGDDCSSTRLHIRLGVNLLNPGCTSEDRRRAREHLLSAESLLSDKPEGIDVALVHYGFSRIARATHHLRETLSQLRRANDIYQRTDGRNLRLDFAGETATVLLQFGKIAEGQSILEQVQTQLDDPAHAGQVLNVVWSASGWHYALWDQPGAHSWLERELAKPRLDRNMRRPLKTLIAHAHLLAGESAPARRIREEDPSPSIEGKLAFYEGDWACAAEAMERGLEQTRLGAYAHGNVAYEQSLARIRRCNGQLDRAETLLQEALTHYPSDEPHLQVEMVVRPELALVYLDLDKRDAAVSQVERCREIMASGENWRGLAGHAARAEAVLAAGEFNREEAERQFARAVEVFDRYVLPFEAAETFLYWGRALKATGDSRANEKFEAAIEIYRRHGAGQRWIDRVEERSAPRASRIEAGPRRAAMVSSSAEGPAIFKREGDFWTLAYRGTTFRLRNVKGLAFIAFLLAHPGERFHVRELIARVESATEAGSGTSAEVPREVSIAHDLGDAGAALDPHARTDYRRRLRELDQDLAEAERMNDRGRIEAIRREQDFLTEELSATVGIGGRDRKAAAHVERVRDVVTKNIHGGLRKIRNEDATLGRHFAASIKTGYYCAYLPDPERRISWQL